MTRRLKTGIIIGAVFVSIAVGHYICDFIEAWTRFWMFLMTVGVGGV